MRLKPIAVIVLSVAGMPLFAQTAPPRIDARQAEQQRRIDRGVQSGALTAKEATRLQSGQQRVQAMEDRAMADGMVTKQERRGINHAQNVQSRKITREKHDQQRDINHDGRQDRPGKGRGRH